MQRKYSIADLPEAVTVFPLPGALLLPRARLPLNIFEPRYLAMFDHALKSDDRLVGMVQPRNAEQSGEDADLHEIGCAGRITSFSETNDGRYVIALTGVCRFRVGRRIPGFLPFIRAEVDWCEFEDDLARSEPDPDFDRKTFLDTLVRFLEASELRTDWDVLKKADEEMLINTLSMLCPFKPEEKQALLESRSLRTRRETLQVLMEFALHGGSAEKDSLQ